MSSTDFSKPSPLAIGAIKADCPKCHGLLFVRTDGEYEGQRITLRCIACNTVNPYTLLLGRVSSAVIAHATAVLAEANSIRRAVLNAQVEDGVRKRLEEYIAR